MDCLMSIGTWIAQQVAEYTLKPIGRQVCYVVQYKTNITSLHTQVDNLAHLKDRVQHSVDEALRKNERIEADVEKWIESVNEIIADANEFFEKERQANNKCLHGLCPNLKPRHELSRKSTKMVEVVAELIHRNGGFTCVSYIPHPQGIRTTSITCNLESRVSIVDRIIEELANPNINMIGVYGLGGVGKTTLAKQVGEQVQVKKLFDEVAMAIVTQNPDPYRIQGEIADMLGLKFQQETIAGRALSLNERISEDKKILIILDDAWKKLDLGDVGLDPICKCKILFTSRSREILLEMGTQKEFRLEVLPEEEAWSLFEKKAGDVVKDLAIRNVAVEVAKRCAGLPVLIITVASSLRNKSLHSWKDALRCLKRFDKDGMQQKAYSALEWSYCQLRDNETKLLFLLCGMVVAKNTIVIKDLMKYSFGLGMFENVDTLSEAQDRLHSLVDCLKDACLLLDGDDSQHAKMHDLVRDGALSIASKDQQILSLPYGNELKEWPKENFLKNCTKISLPFCTVPELPTKLQCPKLEMFLLYNDDYKSERKVSNSFFEEMKELKVLILTQLPKLSLPPSFHSLTNLQTLCLDECSNLGDDDIVLVGGLRNLEILSLKRLSFHKLPKEIRQLTRLRLLDLSHCYNLEVIPPNVISSLSRLEELNMKQSFDKWEVEGSVTGGEKGNASLSELKHLSQLTTLNVHVPDASLLPTSFFSSKLESFIISIGSEWDIYVLQPDASKTLKLGLKRRNQLDESLRMLVKKSEDVCLTLLEDDDDVNNINMIPELDSGEGFPHMKHLHIQRTPSIKHIIESTHWNSSSHPACFLNLESLTLSSLNNLESIYYAQLRTESFGKLRIIAVDNCPRLRNLFPVHVAKYIFQHLQELEVKSCGIMEEMLVDEKEDNNFDIDQVTFPIECCQLQSLKLSSLTQLVHFSFESNMPATSTQLFNWKVVFPNLKILSISDLPKLTSIWISSRLSATHDHQLDSFRNLHEVEIKECKNLKYVFSASIARGLEQLETLSVENCEAINEIIAKEEDDDHDQGLIVNFLFSKVRYLCLKNLPQLRKFYPGMHTSKWPSLEYILIFGCEKVETFAAHISTFHHTTTTPFFFIEKDSFPKLSRMSFGGKEILYGPLAPAECFPTLEDLYLSCIHFTSAEFPFAASLDKLPCLQSMTVYRAFYKVLFMEQQTPNEHIDNGGDFAALTYLRLYRLPKLVYLSDANNSNSNSSSHHAAVGHRPLVLFPNLKTLEVEECRRLKNLQSAAISFHNLTSLNIFLCHEMSYLFTYSIAAIGLNKLTSMTVQSCKRMTEIVSTTSSSMDGDGDGDEDPAAAAGGNITIFSSLKNLSLIDLPSLSGFCSGNSMINNAKLPSIETLTVSECCLEMEISPDGTLIVTVDPTKQAQRLAQIAEEDEEEDDEKIIRV